jgi:hypothetical protein
VSEGRTNPDDRSGDDFVLRAPECRSREELERELEGPIVLRDLSASKPPPPQFSLGDLMILMVGIAAGLAGGSWMPTDVFAALLGLATLVGLLIVSWHPPESRLGKLIWTSFIVAYFMAVLAAILRPPTNAGP